MEYKLKKTQLTFSETLRVVTDAVDACFETDKNGVDVEFRPEIKDVSLQCAFCENYLELELSEDFNEAYATYMAVDIDEYMRIDAFENERININQWYSIRHAVDEKIEFRKQKMLQKNIKVTSILDEEIIKFSNVLTEVVQKLPQGLDMSSIQPFMDKINSMGKIDEKKLVNAVVNKNQSLKNRLFGHRKPKKNKNVETPTSTEE